VLPLFVSVISAVTMIITSVTVRNFYAEENTVNMCICCYS